MLIRGASPLCVYCLEGERALSGWTLLRSIDCNSQLILRVEADYTACSSPQPDRVSGHLSNSCQNNRSSLRCATRALQTLRRVAIFGQPWRHGTSSGAFPVHDNVVPSEYAANLEKGSADAGDRASLSFLSAPCSMKAPDCRCCIRQLRSWPSQWVTKHCASLSLLSFRVPPCTTDQNL